jgi:hypothetical protein
MELALMKTLCFEYLIVFGALIHHVRAFVAAQVLGYQLH